MQQLAAQELGACRAGTDPTTGGSRFNRTPYILFKEQPPDIVEISLEVNSNQPWSWDNQADRQTTVILLSSSTTQMAMTTDTAAAAYLHSQQRLSADGLLTAH